MILANSGLIDRKPSFSLAYYFSGRVQCPAAAPVAYRVQHYCSYRLPGFIDSRAARARRLWEIKSPLPVQAPASGQCRRLPTVSAQPQPADADGTSRSAHEIPRQSPKARRRPKQAWKLKARVEPQGPKFLPNWPEKLVEDQSKRGRPKRESKPKVRVEARSACRNRILTLMSKQC